MYQVNTLTPEEVVTAISRPEVKLVDVRTPEEYKVQRIPNCLLIPLQEFATLYSKDLSSEDEIIVYCQAGMRSQKAANFLINHGYTNVSHMSGGLANWHGPLESG
jgi:rhodanese-related sulfurtransferase